MIEVSLSGSLFATATVYECEAEYNHLYNWEKVTTAEQVKDVHYSQTVLFSKPINLSHILERTVCSLAEILTISFVQSQVQGPVSPYRMLGYVS